MGTSRSPPYGFLPMKAEEDVTQRGRYDWWRRAIVMGRSCLTRHIVYKNGTFYGRLHRNGKGAESLYMHTLYELRKAALALECMNVLWHYQRMTANETDVCSVSVFFFFFYNNQSSDGNQTWIRNILNIWAIFFITLCHFSTRLTIWKVQQQSKYLFE